MRHVWAFHFQYTSLKVCNELGLVFCTVDEFFNNNEYLQRILSINVSKADVHGYPADDGFDAIKTGRLCLHEFFTYVFSILFMNGRLNVQEEFRRLTIRGYCFGKVQRKTR